jgi:polyhydroxyalkanoate synthesis regulator phasin
MLTPCKKARARIEALERSIEQLEARQTRLIRNLEHTDDPHGAMFRKIRDRISEMENERVQKPSELESLQQEILNRILTRSIFWMNFQPKRPTSQQLRARFSSGWSNPSGLRSVTTNRRIGRTAASPGRSST